MGLLPAVCIFVLKLPVTQSNLRKEETKSVNYCTAGYTIKDQSPGFKFSAYLLKHCLVHFFLPAPNLKGNRNCRRRNCEVQYLQFYLKLHYTVLDRALIICSVSSVESCVQKTVTYVIGQ